MSSLGPEHLLPVWEHKSHGGACAEASRAGTGGQHPGECPGLRADSETSWCVQERDLKEARDESKPVKESCAR